MQIFVKDLGGQTFTLDVEPSDTVESVRTRMQDMQYPFPDQHQRRLLFADSQLEDDSKTLAHYNVKNFSTIHVALRLLGGMRVNYIVDDMIEGPLKFLNVQLTDTVLDLKKELEKREGAPLRFLRILYCGAQFEDHRTLAHYKVQENHVLQVLTPPSAKDLLLMEKANC